MIGKKPSRNDWITRSLAVAGASIRATSLIEKKRWREIFVAKLSLLLSYSTKFLPFFIFYSDPWMREKVQGIFKISPREFYNLWLIIYRVQDTCFIVLVFLYTALFKDLSLEILV